MIHYNIDIVDDEFAIRDSLEIALSEDYKIRLFEDAETFLKALETALPDLVLMDIGLPGMSGIEALESLKTLRPELPVIMITAYEDIGMVIRSMKQGAFDFILKPLNLDVLEITIRKAISTIALRKEVKLLQEKFLKENQPCFIGESNAIQDVMDFIDLVAKSPDTPILIRGETGTGKELIAKAIHVRSPNFQGPFVAVNCAAIPEELIESELFGYESGAFSGAAKKGKKGLIEESENGTLFLDEVGDLSSAGQAKLLRFLESGEFYKVGGTSSCVVKTRVVSATNKDLESLIQKKQFRNDLYFRLAVIRADIPSLNERKEDILPLAKHFLFEFNQKYQKSITGLSTVSARALVDHTWTGNVRELRNVMERAALVAQTSEILPQDLGLQSSSPSGPPYACLAESTQAELPDNGIDLETLLKQTEKKFMEKALERTGGNESQAARLLGLNHHTFRYRWKKLNPS